MNKCIRQNWRLFNNIKGYPLGDLEDSVPRTKQEAAEWLHGIWEHLVNDELKRHAIYVKRGTGTKKYTITVWSDADTVYLVFCNRTEFNTDSTAIYIKRLSDSNLQDFINIAKFTHKNIYNITGKSIEAYKKLDEIVNQSEVINGKA